MIRFGLLLTVGLVILATLSWNAGRHSIEPQPTHSAPSPTYSPEPTESVGPPLLAPGPQIIERERVTERVSDQSDSSDNSDAPTVRVVVPTSRPTTNRPTPTRTISPSPRPTLPIDLLETPVTDLPLLP